MPFRTWLIIVRNCTLYAIIVTDKETLQAHISRQHQQPPAPAPAPQPAQATVTSPPASTNTPEEEAQVPSADDSVKGTTDPDTSTASNVNIHPAHPGFTCGMCKAYCSTNASFRIHMTTHKKTPCLFCPQKYYNIASRNAGAWYPFKTPTQVSISMEVLLQRLF